MPLAPEFYTADMVRDIPEDGKRHELVWGELLVSPAPTLPHQRIARRFLWTPDQAFPAVETDQLTWQPAGAPEPLKIALATLLD